MLTTLLVLSPFGLLLAVLLLASRRSRVTAAGGPAVSPADSSPASRGAAVPVVTDLPEPEGRTAFAYDNGLKVGDS
jgi:hypothetical protein